MLMNLARSKLPWLVIFGLFILAAILRVGYAGTEVCFHTDQSRDALVAQKILSGDLQLFGPVVNGRGALFHGVLYYYLLAPLYLIAKGNPQHVTMLLALISALAVFPTYLLAKYLLKQTYLALVVVTLLTFSASSIQTAAGFWNLVLSTFLLPLYGYLVFAFLTRASVKNGLLVGLCAGLLVQSGLSNSMWLLPLVALIMIVIKKSTSRVSLLPSIIGMISVFLVAVSSILLVELLAWERGLFALEETGLHWLAKSPLSVQNLQTLLAWVLQSTGLLLSPTIAPIGVAILLLTTGALVIVSTKPTLNKLLFVTFLAAPIIGQFVTNGFASYLLTGFESILYVCVVYVVYILWKRSASNFSYITQAILVSGLLALFIVSNMLYLIQQKNAHESIVCMLQTNYYEKLQAIDFVYQRAEGQSFSIDIAAEPYGVNTTYGYLFSWYGQQKYGYVPAFIGPTQVGLPSEGLLEERSTFAPVHYIIYEPGTFNYWLKRRQPGAPPTRESQALFYYRQPPSESLTDIAEFGSTVSVERFQNSTN